MRILLLAAASGLALSTAAHAEMAVVDEVIVTATRLPSPAEEIPGVRVIGREEIEARQAAFATDVLKTVPGLSVFNNGAAGGNASVRMRGAETDKTLVLIDGIPLNDPSLPDGGFDFASFDLSDVEQVEILAGPQGSIWGSDAIGGVIAFTTRELNGWRAAAEAGSHDTRRASAAFGIANDDHAVGVSASAYRTDGISAVATGTENDPYETWTASANGRKDFGPVQIDGRVRYTDHQVEQDGYDDLFVFGDTDSRYESQAWSGFARARLTDPLGLKHAFSVSRYAIERASIASTAFEYEAERDVLRWTAERGAPADVIAFVVGAERDETNATVSTGEDVDQGASAAFGVLRWRPDERFTATGSLRHDDPDEYEAETTARASAAAKLGAGFVLSAAWGQGFKTPTISHTVCDFCFPEAPSTGLVPERAEGWDLRLAWGSSDGRIEADVTGYRLRVRDQIAYFYNPDDFTSRYINLEKTLTKGIEAQARVELTPALSAGASYAWTDAIDAVTGAPLVRAPEHSGSVSLFWDLPRHRGALVVRGESEQNDIDPASFTPAEREGFVTADVSHAWEFADGIELTARVVNLTDEEFQETLGYGEYGRSAYIGVRIRR